MLARALEPNVVWKPLDGSQALALDTRCQDTLFTGTRGPGKTDCQLMRFRRRVGLGYGAFWRGIIFDREYKNLDDLVSKSKRTFPKFDDGAQFLASVKDYKWVWPTGEELLFRAIKKPNDYEDYHGHEYPYIGWNELTKYPTSELFDKMMSCNRSSFTPEKDSPDKSKLLPPIPLETFATTNSIGPGRNWVKSRFIDVAPYGQIVRKTYRVFDPQTQAEVDITRSQVAIFGSYKENKHLSALYIASLTADPDENRKKSWLEGDWDVVSGGAMDDVWDKRVHVLPRFPVPVEWRLDRTFDWGSTQPFSVGWWAEANGEEVKLDKCKYCGLASLKHSLAAEPHEFEATIFCPPKGSLIQCAEWYGTKELGSNKGVKMPSGKVAEGIRDREIELMMLGWIHKQPLPGPADNSIRDVKDKEEDGGLDTIEKKMADKGIRWTSSDKSAGSRRIGLELMRERLSNAITCDGPALYFMENCRASIVTIPVLPRDEYHYDDVDSEAEDHPYDMARYRVLKGNNRLARKVAVSWPN